MPRAPRMSVLRWRRLAAGLLLALAGVVQAQDGFEVELAAPDVVRPLLEQHVRLLREQRELPEDPADRSALARRTRAEVADLLATEGYFTAEVRLDRSERRRWRLVVEPGRRSEVVAVDIAFAGEIATDPQAAGRIAELRRQWSLAAGAPFRQADWDAAKQGLLDELTRKRYAAAHLATSRAEVDPEAATVRLAVSVDSGPSFRLGRLQISGVEHLPADLIERYSTLEPGELYDRDALLAFQTALQNAPHFASVVVDIDPDPALAAAVPVRVQVAEALPRRVGFGAGFSSNTGYRVEGSYRDANLFGRGWELASGLRLEQRRQAAYADVFLPPTTRGHRDSVGALIDRSDVEGLRLSTQAIGVARNTVRDDIETQIALRFQHEEMRPDGARATAHDTFTANWTWTRRAVDNLLDPRRGHVLEFQIGGGTSLALAEQDFLRLYSRYVHYQPVGAADTLILRVEGGVTLAPSRDGIPQDFLFRTGGAQTVRGYAYQSLGVREGDATVGGRYMAVASAEYVRWFRPEWGAAFFVDSGDAADTRAEFSARTGYGVGARWRSPAGPLAADLAWSQEERRLRLHFGVAIAF